MKGPRPRTFSICVDSGEEARVLAVNEAEFAHKKDAGVEVLASEAFDECLAFSDQADSRISPL